MHKRIAHAPFEWKTETKKNLAIANVHMKDLLKIKSVK